MIRLVLELPLLLFLLAFGAAWLCLQYTPAGSRAIFAPWLCGVAMAVSLLGLCVTFAFLIGRARLFWADEATTLSVSSLLLHGSAPYTSIKAPVLYSLLYGPITFFWYVPFLELTPHCLPPIRTALCITTLLALLAMYDSARNVAPDWVRFGLLTIASAALLASPRAVLMVAADEPIFVLCAVGLWAALRLRIRAALAAVGACCGLMVNCKATLLFVALLLLLILWKRFDLRAGVLAAAVAILVAVLPFLLPNISFGNYAGWVALVGRQKMSAALLLENLLFLAFLLSGFCLLTWKRGITERNDWLLAIGFLLCAGVSTVTGAKSGSGVWHLIPLLPFVLYGTVRVAMLVPGTAREHIIPALAIAGMLGTLRYAVRDVEALYEPRHADYLAARANAERELNQLQRTFPSSRLAWAGGVMLDSVQSDLRYELPLAGDEEVVDPVSYAEVRRVRADVSPSLTMRALGCSDLWLVPHNEIPFSTENTNAQKQSVPFIFPDTLRLDFKKAHNTIYVGQMYDVWGCGKQ